MKVWPNEALATAWAVDLAVMIVSEPFWVTVTLDGVVLSRSRPLRYQELSSLMNSFDSGARQASSSGPVLISSVPRTRIDVSVPVFLLTTYRKSLPDTTISSSFWVVASLPACSRRVQAGDLRAARPGTGRCRRRCPAGPLLGR